MRVPASRIKKEISQALEEQFRKLFVYLGNQGTRIYIEKTIKPLKIKPNPKFYLGEVAGEEDVSDLAD